jgi:4-hydroxy-tetrahydrodipicolinate synthase
MPIFIYNIPVRAGVNMEISTLKKLSQEENILGIKDTTVDMARFMNLLFHFRQRNDFSLFQGSELLLAPSFIFGGDGAISALANIDPKLHVDIYQAAMNKDVEKAYQLQKKMNFLFTIFSAAGNPGLSINNFPLGIKIALNLLGICDSYVCQIGRKPKKEEINRVEQILLKRGLLKK